MLFDKRDENDAPFSPEVAAVAMALQYEDQCPRLLLTVWPQIVESVRTRAQPPAVRALRSDDERVWVLAPEFESGRNIRGGLVLVSGTVEGPVSLRDIDRPLNTYNVKVPMRSRLGWLEGNSLLLAGD